MNLGNIFESINYKNNYLVIPNNLKARLIKKKSSYEINKKALLKFNVITISELISLLSFTIDSEAYLYNLEKYNRPITITKEMFNFSKYNLEKENELLVNFINDNKQFVIKNTYFINNLSNYKFNILGSDILLKPFIDYYKLNIDYISLKDKHQPQVLKFITKEEEVFYMFEQISKLLQEGTNINDIYISNVDNSYYNDIKKLSKFYNIPVNLNITESLLNIPYIKDITNKSYQEIIELLSDIDNLRELYKSVRLVNAFEFDSNINKLINVFNNYPHEEYSQEVILPVITEDIKNTNVKSTIVINNAVSLISLDEIIGLDDKAKVFILNTTYEAFPKIAKDNDFLSDKDKELINYPTSSMVNISNNNYLEKIITSKNIKYLSYALRDNYLEYTPSDITSRLSSNIQSFTKISLDDINNNYANNYYKSIFSSKNSDILQTTFTGQFNLNDEQRAELIRHLKQKEVKISPSQVTTYYKLPFIYYLERILGLNTFSESISLHIGNFFHSIIEVLMLLTFEHKVDRSTLTGTKKYSYDEDIDKMIFHYIIKKGSNMDEVFDYELYFDEFFDIYFYKQINEVNNYETINLSSNEEMQVKTLFYVKKHKQTITTALSLIVDLEVELPSEELLIEREIELSNFRGQADLVKVYSDNKYSIIDYKTGSRDAFNKDAIIELINSLLASNNEEIPFGTLDLLQLILYAYFFYKDKPDLELKDLAYFSYFEDRLNGITTEGAFDSLTYNKGRGKGRYIDKEELELLFLKVEELLNQTLNDIKNFKFPVEIRRDSKTKAGMDKSYYSVYEALAFYSDNSIEEDIDED